MAKTKPTEHDYLAVVSEWTGMAQRGGQVGNAYPLMNVTTGEVVSDPTNEFPNPGAVFLTSRGSLKTWDFILLRPEDNRRYTNAGQRDCYYIPGRQPTLLANPNQAENVAVVLDHPTFDPSSSAHQLQGPRHNVTPLFFIQKNQTILGPFVRDATHLSPVEELQRIDWRPANDDGTIFEFTREELAQNGIKLAQYTHPEPWLNRVLASPLLLAFGPVRRAKSARPRDALPDAGVIEWYLARCPGAETSSQQLAALKAAFKGAPGDDPIIQAARLRKIERLLATHVAFAEQRERFARQYLESEAGQQRARELLEQAVARRASEVQAEVDRRQAHLAQKRNELDRQLAEAEMEYQNRLSVLRRERDQAQEEAAGLQSAAAELREQLAADSKKLAARLREQMPLLAALASVRPPPAPAPQGGEAPAPAPAPARRAEFRPVPPAVPPRPVQSEAALVDELHAGLARGGLHFSRDFVANVYVCLKAEPLNLIIGPPGHGKSMLVSALAGALGHPDALLRIAVRRSWSEDRHLLGFYDSFHGRYDPGPTGLVPRMLQAEADWRQGRLGVYFVLLDEFNLAAPEYYFSQLLQALPADGPSREVRLYDPGSADGGGFPARVVLTPNLRFWGTINYDETTERLSPRALDRTGMIFLGEADVSSPPEGDEETPPGPGVAASDLFERLFRPGEDCPEEHWALVSGVIDLLRSPEPKFGRRVEVSPRVRAAVRRYLANSAGVLAPRLAADFVVQQRILPVVRGQGEEFVARIARLQQLLSDANLSRSAAHVEEVLRRSEQQFGDLDFLSY